MGDNNPARVQQEIGHNMSVAAAQPFAMTAEEMAFSGQQNFANNRALRKRSSLDTKEQQRNTQNWVNRTSSGVGISMGVKRLGAISALATPNMAISSNLVQKESNLQVDVLAENLTQTSLANQNNRASSENMETIRENIKNSRESLKKKSCENILTIEEASRSRSRSFGSTNQIDSVNLRNSQNKPMRPVSDSVTSLNESTDDFRRMYRSGSIVDAHSAAIDLSNNCRKFYFSHCKSAEAIKKAVRAAKHTRAQEKMAGKKCTSFDNAMDRLRSEMADLMDQDLSLMKQLLKLNDKIEEIKTQVIYRNRNEAFSTSSMSTSEISDSEYSDTDDSRIDIYNASTGTHKLKTLKSLNHLGKAHVRHPEEVDSEAETADESNDVSFGHEPKLIERSGSDVIVYRKKHRKKHRSKSHRNSGDETETQTEGSDSSDTEGSISDTESSCDSGSTKMAPSDGDDNLDDVIDAPDSGIQSPTPEKAVEPPKPRKGGISQNSSFLNFHKTNGTRNLNPLAGNVLTHQGHNISLEKYFIPQGLVYLKHANADNVFCQFTK